jgi:hypothetical protein
MPTLLSDPSTSLYVILGVISVILGSIALRRQKRSDAINFAIPLAALVALFLIDYFVESPREQVVKAIQEMETATQNKKHEDVFKHVSEKFQYESLDKKGLQEKAKHAESIEMWKGIRVAGLQRKGFTLKGDIAEQKFYVEPLGYPVGEYQFDCTAFFKKEGERWMLTGFIIEKNGQKVTPPGL